MKKSGRMAETETFFRSVSFGHGDLNVISKISTNADSSKWQLFASWSTGDNISAGIITEDKEYEVRLITETEQGGGSKFFQALDLWMGFEIYDGDKAIGAIQTMPIKSGRATYAIWIDPSVTGLDEDKLAGACIALLVTTNQNLLSMQ